MEGVKKVMGGRRAIMNASLQLAMVFVQPSKLAPSTKLAAQCGRRCATVACHVSTTVQSEYAASVSPISLRSVSSTCSSSSSSSCFPVVAALSKDGVAGPGLEVACNRFMDGHVASETRYKHKNVDAQKGFRGIGLPTPPFDINWMGIQSIDSEVRRVLHPNFKMSRMVPPYKEAATAHTENVGPRRSHASFMTSISTSPPSSRTRPLWRETPCVSMLGFRQQSTSLIRQLNTIAMLESPSSISEATSTPASMTSSSSVAESAHVVEARMFSGGGQAVLPSSSEGDLHASRGPIWHHVKTKALTKQAQHIMNILSAEAVDDAKKRIEYPKFQPGDVLQLKVEIPENRRRVSVVKGVCIARRNSGIGSTFRIRRILNGQGIEYLYPLYSPNLKEIKILERRKVRRAKLYYLREKNPKFCNV